MHQLRDLVFDDAITESVVSIGLGDDAVRYPTAEAVRVAREQGMHLVRDFESTDGVAYCTICPLAVPPRWEQPETPFPPVPPIDEKLWFTSSLGCRDYVLGRADTVPGRITAWCPHDQQYPKYNISLTDLHEASQETRYFVAGLLAGVVPGPPPETRPSAPKEDRVDFEAWWAAQRRFRDVTGEWSDAWSVCVDCGAVLLPSTVGERCARHDDGSSLGGRGH